MSRILRALAVVTLLGATLVAAAGGFEQITVANTAIGLTTSKIAPSGTPQMSQVSCRLELAEIRWTDDGTTPTTTVGTLLEIGDVITLTGTDNLRSFLAIRTGATSGQLDCTYYR